MGNGEIDLSINANIYSEGDLGSTISPYLGHNDNLLARQIELLDGFPENSLRFLK